MDGRVLRFPFQGFTHPLRRATQSRATHETHKTGMAVDLLNCGGERTFCATAGAQPDPIGRVRAGAGMCTRNAGLPGLGKPMPRCDVGEVLYRAQPWSGCNPARRRQADGNAARRTPGHGPDAGRRAALFVALHDPWCRDGRDNKPGSLPDCYRRA